MQDNKVTQSSHYSLENKRDSSDLLITNITETDAGVYICQINTEPTRNHVTNYYYLFSIMIHYKYVPTTISNLGFDFLF